MSTRISIDNLEAAIRTELRNYTQEVQQEVIRAVEDTAREVRDIVADTSPRRTGRYKRGWRVRLTASGNWIQATVHGIKPTYRLAHLLANGHAKRGGGRVPPAHDIGFAEAFGEQQLQNRIEDAIKRVS